jgi:nitrogen regulatory protein P-II 1|tara:strand:+ start:413 stop:754 length:342 start_codon:yes stop_codon:yes gene_type:complete
MKRIEATIQNNKVSVVTDAIKEIVGGFTILEGNGRGSGKRQNIGSGRGTNTMIAEYNKVVIITTIVDDLIVEKVSKIIEDVAFTGETSDGIIVVSNIESVLNISSKEKNSKAL